RADDQIEVLLRKAQLAQTQQRLLCRIFDQWIDVCDRVAKRTIRVNKSINTRLQRRVFMHAGFDARIRAAKLEALEECGPMRLDRFGGVAPAFVIFLKQCDVDVSCERNSHWQKAYLESCGAGKLPARRRGANNVQLAIAAADKLTFSRHRPRPTISTSAPQGHSESRGPLRNSA